MIDFFNHVAFLQFRHAAIGIDVGDQDTLHIRRQIKLARSFRSEFVHVN